MLAHLASTVAERFGRHLARPVPAPAGMQKPRELAGHDPASDLFRFTVAAVLWQRNRAVRATGEPAGAGGDILAGKEIRR